MNLLRHLVYYGRDIYWIKRLKKIQDVRPNLKITLVFHLRNALFYSYFYS